MSGSGAEKILVVDDAPANLRALAELLKPHYTVILAKSGEQARERARRQRPDLILLDVMMPGIDGFELLQLLKADAATAAIPVMFITGLNEPDHEARGLELGAVDYVSKPINPVVVLARIATQLRLARQRRLLENLAHIDGLTELPNRRAFDEAYAAEWRRARRAGTPLAVAMIDVDCFKQFNDHRGHAEGDRALQKVGRVLAGLLQRPGDLAARIGGEEFALMLPHTGGEGALRLGEAVRAQIEHAAIHHPASSAAPCVTVSVGVASTDDPAASALDSPEALRGLADHRLYRAKAAGRNRVVGP